MSKYDNYGGVTHDPELDGGDVIDWNPVENLDIDDAEWEETYADPTEWNEATVSALVWMVEVPPHDAEGNVRWRVDAWCCTSTRRGQYSSCC